MEYPTNYTELVPLMGSVIEFTDEVYKTELFPDVKMRGRIVDFGLELPGTDDEHFYVVIDMSEFVEYNRRFMRANFYDDRRNPTQTWEESGLYPSNHRERCYMDWKQPVFRVVSPNDPGEFTDLIESLWASDEANSLTNQAARALEKTTDELREDTGVIRVLRRSDGAEAEELLRHTYNILRGMDPDAAVDLDEVKGLILTAASESRKQYLKSHGV